MSIYLPTFRKMVFAWFCLVVLSLPSPSMAHGVHFFAGELPPYISLVPNGPPTGFAVELLREVMREAGEPFPASQLEVTNWARAVHEVELSPGKALLSLTMLPERRDRFKWVGPIYRMAMGMMARKGDGIVVGKKEELLRYRIAVVRNTAPVSMLINAVPGIENNLVQVSSIKAQIRMLQEGRVDLMVQSILAGRLQMVPAGVKSEEFPMVFPLEPVLIYYGFNKTTDDEYIARLQEGLDRLKAKDASGTSPYGRLLRKYGLSVDGAFLRTTSQ